MLRPAASLILALVALIAQGGAAGTAWGAPRECVEPIAASTAAPAPVEVELVEAAVEEGFALPETDLAVELPEPSSVVQLHLRNRLGDLPSGPRCGEGEAACHPDNPLLWHALSTALGAVAPSAHRLLPPAGQPLAYLEAARFWPAPPRSGVFRPPR